MAKSRGKAPVGRRGKTGVPSAAAISAFVRGSPVPVGTGEIARAFAVAPADRSALRDRLRRIEGSGEVSRVAAGRLAAGPALPGLAVVERIGADEDGVPLARPVDWPGPGPAPLVRLTAEGDPGFPVGARALARLALRETGDLEAQVIRRLDTAGERIVGIYERDRDGGRVVPADRRNRTEHRIAARDTDGAQPGELVAAETLPATRYGPPRARIVERLGPPNEPGAISRLAIAAFDIPNEFPAAALAEAAAAAPTGLDDRVDLRDLPLVTIDGSDARDFDDAVWAEPDRDPANPGGWHITVAIADVAFYVPPGGALDQEAERRGNSVYFPDQVVPMLPETLSHGLCSLQPGAERACLAVDLTIDAAGRKRGHRFVRGLMRSAARLTYEEVQAIRDRETAPPPAVSPAAIAALYGAFAVLAGARAARGALDLDLREDRVVLDDAGRPAAVVPVARLDSHRLIEEFMILANVAAAEELEARHRPCLYRIHDSPDPDKVEALREFLAESGIPGLALAKGQALKPELFNRLLRRAAETPVAPLVNELVLRSQAQAVYSPDNIGHFGLALRRYAHFTSPIRRYADLTVHRALLAGGRGRGPDPAELAALGEHLSATERRAAAAERAALDRYRVLLLSPAVGHRFAAQISGVADFGLFVTAADSGATGLVPIATLPPDYYDRRDKPPRLVGRRHGRVFRLGDSAFVRLAEADVVGGRLLFRIDAGEHPDRFAKGRRGG